MVHRIAIYMAYFYVTFQTVIGVAIFINELVK